jgi:hemolysin III
MEAPDQSMSEEIANSVSHGIGAALCLTGLILLTIRAASVGSVRSIVCSAVFGASAVLLYLSSTLYHSLSHTKAFRVMRSVDHGSIYLLIAGTYTPFTLIGLRGPLGWTLFAIVWSCALVGVIVKAFFVGRWEILSTAMYLAMGWVCVFAIKSMYAMLSHPVFGMIMAGGVCYSAGIPFFSSQRKYMHFIWHLWVLAGTACHFAAIWMLVR